MEEVVPATGATGLEVYGVGTTGALLECVMVQPEGSMLEIIMNECEAWSTYHPGSG